MSKLCVFCRRFYLDMGSPGYSEYTPGEEASIYCIKDHWQMSNYGDVSEYRMNILKAKTCPDYDQCDE